MDLRDLVLFVIGVLLGNLTYLGIIMWLERRR